MLLTIDNRIVDLLAEEYDVAIRIGPLADSDLIARRLTTFELFPCASPTYLHERSPTVVPADLASHTIVGHRASRENWSFQTERGVKGDVEIETRTAVPEPDVARTMLAAGAGIGILPDFHAAALIASGGLVRVQPDHRHCTADVHALYPSHRSLSSKVRVFIDAVSSSLSGRDGEATIEP